MHVERLFKSERGWVNVSQLEEVIAVSGVVIS